MILVGTKTAIAPGITASFGASGGTEPYFYEVLPGGAGGTINPTTGLYTAPATQDPDVSLQKDIIQVTDDDDATETAEILVCNHLELFCDILQKELELDDGRVYLWNQKLMQPKDNGIYIAVSVISTKPFGNSNTLNADGFSIQNLNVLASLQIDIISRGPGARDRKEEIVLALNSNYSKTQQQGNGFSIANLSTSFVNLSEVDGAAIPYRFSIAANIQYFIKKQKAVDYFDTFDDVTITTEA